MEHMDPGITIIFILFLTVLTVHVSSEISDFFFLSIVLHFFLVKRPLDRFPAPCITVEAQGNLCSCQSRHIILQ